MTDPIDVLSGSSLNTFLRCAKQWEYAYVYRFKRPPSLRMVVGTAGHKAIEVHMKAKAASLMSLEDGPLDVALDAYSDEYDKEVAETDEPDKAKGQSKDHGVKSVRFWHAKVAPNIVPDMVEQPISFRINDKQTWTGTIDLTSMEREVIDHKFTGKTPNSADAYLLNMVGYAVGYREQTGHTESRIVLDHIVGLQTKTTHVPIVSDGPVTDGAIRAFADIVDTATRSIDAGIFPPTGLKSGACSWCGYKDICPAYKESPMRQETE